MPEMRNWIEIYQVNLSLVNLKCLLLLEIKLSRSRDETLFFKLESIVVREKTIAIFIRLGFMKRD